MINIKILINIFVCVNILYSLNIKNTNIIVFTAYQIDLKYLLMYNKLAKRNRDRTK